MGRAYDLRVRSEALQVYGGRCFCCGENWPPFLCLDHVNNDGAEHRQWLKQNGYGNNFTRALAKLGFPNDPPIQVACWNCNTAKAARGGCPHTGFRWDVANAHRRTRHRYYLRRQAMEAYGGKCVCCGEDELEFLVLDHTAGDGAEHRAAWRTVGLLGKSATGVQLYQTLKNFDWPQDEGMQTMCANCNGAKKIKAHCAHKEV